MPETVVPPVEEATPAEGGSYLRQPDGTLVRQAPAAPTPIASEE